MTAHTTVKAAKRGPDDTGKRLKVTDPTGRLISTCGTYIHKPHPTRREGSDAMAVGYLAVEVGPPLLLYPDDETTEV